jgi:hypothetical protein
MGWIYCIDTHNQDGSLKCGKTDKGKTVEEATAKLLSRYGTGCSNPNVLYIKRVCTSAIAEKALHLKLKEYKVKREFFKAPISVISQCMDDVCKEYPPTSDDTITEVEKNNLHTKCEKICKRLVKKTRISNEFYRFCEKYNKNWVYNALENHIRFPTWPNGNPKDVWHEVYHEFKFNTENELEFVFEFSKLKV